MLLNREESSNKLQGYITGNLEDDSDYGKILSSGSYIEFPNQAGSNDNDIFNEKISGNQPFAIELWALPTSSPSNAALISKGDDQVSISYSSNTTSNVKAGRIPGDMMKLVANITNSQSNNGANEGPANVADNDPNTKWCNTLSTWPETGVFVQYELSTPQVARVFMLTSANDDMSYNRSLKDVRLQGSNNGSSWDTLATETEILFTANYQDRIFYFDNETEYKYYRLCIDETTNGTRGTFQLACFSLGTGEGHQLEPSDIEGKINFTVGGSGGLVTASADVGIDFLYEMQRIVGMFDGSNLQLWINGQLSDSVSVSEEYLINTNSFDMSVGYAPDEGIVSNSNIAGARIFGRVLTEGELRDNNRKPTDSPSGSDVCLWTDFSNSVEKSSPVINDIYENGLYLGYGGNWGEGNHDGYFCANGIVRATRDEEPEIAEVKKQYQNLVFLADDEDLAMGRINVRNEYYATAGSELDFVWSLYEDDKLLKTGTVGTPAIPPMGSETVLVNIPTVAITLPYLSSIPDNLTPGAEYFVKIQACLREDTDWADKGYALSEEQFKLNIKSLEKLTIDRDAMAKISIEEDESNLILNGDSFSINFNKLTGSMTNYTVDNVQLLKSGPEPTFWRALLANDRLGSNSSITAWNNADISKTLNSFNVTPASDGKIYTIEAIYNLPAVNEDSFIDMKYEVFGNGAVNVTTALRTTSTAQMYRFGVDMIMPEGFENIDWYTKGPLENFNDRATGSYVGRYQTTVTDNYYPYIKPQDTGTHQDTRFMALTSDSENTGLMVVSTGDHLFEANALHYSWRDMNSGTNWESTGITHPYLLKPRTDTVLSVNYGSRGTGSESCMDNPPLPPYLLPASNYDYSYTLVPFNIEEQHELAKLSRYYREINIKDDIDTTVNIDVDISDNKIKPIISNTTQDTKDVKLILAIYNSDDILAKIEIKSLTLDAGDSIDYESEVDISLYEGYSYKIFVWEPETNAPLSKVSEGIL